MTPPLPAFLALSMLSVLCWLPHFQHSCVCVYTLMLASSLSTQLSVCVCERQRGVFKFCNSQFAYPANIDLHRRF